MSKTIRGAVADLSKDISYLELSCENDKLKYGIKQLTEENQRLKEENKFLRGEFTFEEWVELQKQTVGEST